MNTHFLIAMEHLLKFSDFYLSLFLIVLFDNIPPSRFDPVQGLGSSSLTCKRLRSSDYIELWFLNIKHRQPGREM